MLTTVRLVSVDDLVARLGTPEQPTMVDVREPEEHAAWHIAGSRNIPLGELAQRLDEIPARSDVVVYCASGRRSALAARVLREAGIPVADLDGGMRAFAGVYDTAELPVGETTVVQVRRRAKGCLSYVVGAGDEAFVVDPSLDVDRYLDVARRHGWRVTRVFETHLHADHLSGARELVRRTDATLHLHPNDGFSFAYSPLADGDSFRLGGRVDVTVASAHTPGHTLGSTTVVVDGRVAFTGDTLFVDGVGRPDLAARTAEFARALHGSLHERVLLLGDDTIVLPAHYGETVTPRPSVPVAATVGRLRAEVPQLALDVDAFVEWCLARTTPPPPNFADIVAANAGHGADPHALVALEDGPNRCSA